MCGNRGWWLPGWVDGAKIAIYAQNILDACISITRASGRVGPSRIASFLGPVKWHRADRRVPIQAQKNSRFPGPNPLPLAQVMYMHESKILCTGLYRNHGCVGGFMHKRPRGRFQSPYCGGWRSRCIKDLITLLELLGCIKELNRPTRAAPPPPLQNLLEIMRKLNFFSNSFAYYFLQVHLHQASR